MLSGLHHIRWIFFFLCCLAADIETATNSTNSFVRGTSQLVQNTTVYGAMITSAYGDLQENRRGQSAASADNIASQRWANARDMIAKLPFPVTLWPPVIARSCPYTSSQHKTERGLAFAHLQIWMDFSYQTRYPEMDGDSAHEAPDRNEYPPQDKDILVIFEDDAEIAVEDISHVLAAELSDMRSDLLYLGWCEGRLAKPVPLCTHAYAVTRVGAKKLINLLEPCGAALDEQFVMMAKNNWISYRTTDGSGGHHRVKLNGTMSKDKGLFYQKRLGSLNGH
jgi:hypothetical protein